MENPQYKLLSLCPIETPGKPGKLVDLDIAKICLQNNINFIIRKCFYINDLDSPSSRGNHSNDNASEILVCLTGSFSIVLFNGKETVIFEMKKNDAIFIDKNIWIKFCDFKECVIMAFVSVELNEKHSCYDFSQYKQQFA